MLVEGQDAGQLLLLLLWDEIDREGWMEAVRCPTRSPQTPETLRNRLIRKTIDRKEGIIAITPSDCSK